MFTHLTSVAPLRFFLNPKTWITDHFFPSVTWICETNIIDEVETLYNISGYNRLTNNNKSNKGELYIKKNIPLLVTLEQTIIRNGIATTFADLNASNGIITDGLVVNSSVTSTLKIYPVHFIKIYMMSDFNINLLDSIWFLAIFIL